jgi:TonB family protein
MPDDKTSYGWEHDEKRADAEPPVITTYPGRRRIGGPRAPGQRPVISIIVISTVIAIGVGVAGVIATGSKKSRPPEAPLPQIGSDRPYVAGETEPPPGQRLAKGLEPPRPADGHMGSASVDVVEVTVAGGGRSRADVEKGLRASYRDLGGAYMDYCRGAGATDRKDELLVRFRITTAGTAEDVAVLTNTTGDAGFEGAARDAVTRARFAAASEDAYVTCRYVLKARMAPETPAPATRDHPIKVGKGVW